jgi:catecholate siderophore receptor
VDRGIPSFQGGPSDADIRTYFGNPDASFADARVHAATAAIDHATGIGLTIRNSTRFVHYDKFYRNVYPGALNAAKTRVTLSAYDHGTTRTNIFNQTDLTYDLATGAVRHTLLAGAEVGRQSTDNIRNTGYFGDSTTSMTVPFDQPTDFTPVTFRQSATDADNRVTNTVAALYAQDQITLSSHWQAIAGVRYERFDITYRDNRGGQTLSRVDHMVSPRAGLIFKPVAALSWYGSYSVSHLPSAGDQFSSLTATTQALAPERFTNYELGAKWDIRSDLALTAAAYRLDRTNTRATDPSDPTRLVQTGSQRTRGYELGVSGRVTSAWQVAAGYASQRASITSATTAAPAGATVPLVPHATISLWNRYQVMPAWGVGLGVLHQSSMFAAIDNTVTLPGFTRIDGALYVTLTRDVRAQVNVENLWNERYYVTSHGNNNIMPGAPRTLRIALTTGH